MYQFHKIPVLQLNYAVSLFEILLNFPYKVNNGLFSEILPSLLGGTECTKLDINNHTN